MLARRPAPKQHWGMTTHTLSSSAAPDVARPALLPRPAAMARDWIYLVSGLPLGILTFTVVVTGLSLAAGLAITLVGIPVLLGTLYLGRWMADVEQARAGWVLGAPVRRRRRAWRGGLWTRFKAAVSDPVAWRDQLWGLLLLPVGIAGFTAAVTLWSVALAMLTSPPGTGRCPRATTRSRCWTARAPAGRRCAWRSASHWCRSPRGAAVRWPRARAAGQGDARRLI